MTPTLAAVVASVPAIDVPNPFSALAGTAAQIVTSGWTAAMLGLWSAGLWVLRAVLGLLDAFLVPDLSEAGPAGELYRVTFWFASTLAVVLVVVQVGLTAFRRDGRALATAVIGAGQFVLLWGLWLGYGVALVAACGGLSTALMGTLLGVDSWAGWQPWAPFDTGQITDASVATVLGLLGLLLWVAAIGHLLVMLTRAGALLVLAATAPIAAAGLVGEVGRGWFWTSLRWFHAAAFTPVLLVLVLGLGVKTTTGVATAHTTLQAAVGTALPGVVLILIGCIAPMALFKLLAFVDPGTTSGAALRAGYAAHGGLSGLLGRGTATAGSGAAAESDGSGRAVGENAAEETTGSRFTAALTSALGPAAAGVGAAQGFGARGAAIGLDLANQMGVGHPSYFPDLDPPRSTSRGSSSSPTGEGPPTAPGPGTPPPSEPSASPLPPGPQGAPSPSTSTSAGAGPKVGAGPSVAPIPSAGASAGAGEAAALGAAAL